MKLGFRVLAASLAFVASGAGSVRADDSGNFVVRLGQDTVGVEHYTRSSSRTEVDQVGRAPRTLRRHFVYESSGGSLTRFSLVVTPPGATTPTQTVNGTVDGDSLRVEIHSGAAPVVPIVVSFPKGTQVVALSSPWSVYESLMMKLAHDKPDSLRGTMYIIGADGPQWFALHRAGRDQVELSNEHMDVFRLRADKSGHLLGVTPISGTGKFTVDRVEHLDVDAYAASFAAREQAGTGLGMLSPRDTVRAENAGSASLWVDYGRPSKRGRAIFGSVVPFGEIWRTGANAATQFKTDKALDFGGTVVPAGFYTLWTIPGPTGWKLVVNSETGQWGTAHKADKDLFTIDLKTSTLPQAVERFTIGIDSNPQGGTLNLEWDTTRASAAFTVKP